MDFPPLWQWLSMGGGGLAFVFILAVLAGILALTALFLGSSVIVLERFGRVARSPLSVVVSALAVAAAATAMSLGAQYPELAVAPWSTWFATFGRVLPPVVAFTLVSVAACWAALRFLAPTTLSRLTLIALGLAIAFYLGSLGRLGPALGPLLAVAVVKAGFLWWRRGGKEPGDFEPLLPWLAAALVPAPVLAVLASAGAFDAFDGGVGSGPAQIASIGIAIGGLLVSLVLFGLLPLAVSGISAMRRTAEWFIAVRYLVAKRRQVFISAITMICVSGIAAGVWLIITVLSVMNGFEKTWRDEIVGNRAHFTLHSGLGPFDDYERIGEIVAGTDGVVGVSPYLDAEGMVRSRTGRIFAVRLRGVDPTSVGDVTDLPDDMIHGDLDDLRRAGAEPDGEDARRDPGIVIGNQLAAMVGAEVGDSLLLISPYGGPPTPLGPAPRLARFDVVGIFQSSFFQYDEVYTYTSLEAAQDFRKAGDVVDGLEARTTDFYRSRRVADAVVDTLDYPYFARDWKDYFPAFFQALKTERVMMFLLLTMIMVVAAFVIVATLIMMIMEKSSDIAILKAMGAADASIERIFAIEGTLIGLAGTALGVVAGIAVTQHLGWLQERIEVLTGIDTLPASIYQFSTLPSEIDPGQISIVAAIAMVLALGATLLPSRQGARIDPVEGLRHE